MTRTLTAALAAACVLASVAAVSAPAAAASRIKDIANFEGVRQNQLIGYGLVVGLNGTGDTLNNIPFTKQSIQAMLERMGVNIRGAADPHRQRRRGDGDGQPAAVRHPGHPHRRHRVLARRRQEPEGGTLLVTPLLGADGNVYAVGQGSVAVAGFAAQGEAAKVTRGVPTVGRISNGAIIEREIEFALNRLNQVRLALRNADFTTAKRIAAAVNDFLGGPVAEPLDNSTVQVTLPEKYPSNIIALLTEIEQLQIEPDLAGQGGVRRTLRRDRDRTRRAGIHGRGVAGQSHRHRRRDPAGEPAEPVLARPHGRRSTHESRRAGGRQEARRGLGRRVAAAAG